jgi:phage shock protein E
MTKTNYTIIDVREPHEFNLGHLEGAINIPSQSLMDGASEIQHLAKDTPLLVYCRSGSRSEIALNILKFVSFRFV